MRKTLGPLRSIGRVARRTVAIGLLAVGLVGVLGPELGTPARAANGEIRVLTVDGIINPVSARYLVRGIEAAEADGVTALVIELNTPGGLLDSTESITGAMLSAEVPVVVWVSPPGAKAASAGVFITMAGHVAAMAPSTRIGAATPVSGDGAEIPEDLFQKILNDTVQYARDIATARGRNADWAEEAVREAVSIGAEEAVEIEVVDLIAADRAELVASLDGRQVTVDGAELTLETSGSTLVEEGMSFFEEVLIILSDPNIAFILLSLGSIGIYFELANPGSFLPGIAGAIFLILALFSLGTLPINYAGLALLILGLALLGAEIFVASGGILGTGGTIAFLLGGLLLIDDTQAPFLEISRPLIYGTTLALALFVLFALRAVMRTRRRPAAIGGNELIGRVVPVRATNSVYVAGELWHARTTGAAALEPGSQVRIIGREGLELIVEPASQPASQTEEQTHG